MRLSTIAVLTLAALGAETGGVVAQPQPDFWENPTPETFNELKQDLDEAPAPTHSLSAPEILMDEAQLSKAPDYHTTFANAEIPLIASRQLMAGGEKLSDLTQAMEASWLAKLVQFGVQHSASVRAATTQLALQTTENNLGTTLTLLNALLVVSTLLPVFTISFFWLIRRLVVRELVGEVNKRLKDIGALETQIKSSGQNAQKLISELDAHILTAKQSIEFLNREADFSKASIEQIETLKSQFLMQLQVIVAEVQNAKYEVLQETNDLRNTQLKLVEPTSSYHHEVTSSSDHPGQNHQSVQTIAETASNSQTATRALATKIELQEPLENPEEVITQRRFKILRFPQQNQELLIADDYVKQGEGWLLDGRVEDALNSFNKAVALNPYLDSGWYYRGTALAKLQRYDEAISSYEKALEITPKKYEIWYNLGNVLGRVQQYKRALECYEKVIELKPEHYESWYNRGALLGRLQQYEQALECYQQVIEIKSDFVEAWQNRAVIFAKIQQYEAALEAYDEAITLAPERHEVWYNRGNILTRLGQYEEALRSYDRAIHYKTDKYEAWYNRGTLLWRLERYQEAVTSYDQALLLKPDDYEIWHNRGAALRKLEEYEEALRSFEKVIELQPECYQAWFGRGEVLENLQRYEEAIEAYDKAIAIKPDNLEAKKHRGALLTELKQTV